MNDSGDAVQQALRFYKLDVDALTVFHDELDLAPMKVKVKVGGGTAGHNGLRSIDAALGPDFRRVRIGIGHPGPQGQGHPLRARQLRQGGDGAAVRPARRHRRRGRMARRRRRRPLHERSGAEAAAGVAVCSLLVGLAESLHGRIVNCLKSWMIANRVEVRVMSAGARSIRPTRPTQIRA